VSDETIYNGHTLSTCDAPSLKTGIYYIDRLKGDENRNYVIYSPSLHGFYTHWSAETGTVPCYKDHSKCIGGHNVATLRQYFLLFAWSMVDKAPVFIYLTPKCALKLLEQAGKGNTLRGRWLKIERSKSDKGRLIPVLGDRANQDWPLREDVDPYPSIFHWMKIPLDLTGPQPALAGDQEDAHFPI
jgi:hypothetical protein